jgi:hypothetical protein
VPKLNVEKGLIETSNDNFVGHLTKATNACVLLMSIRGGNTAG